MPDNETCWNEDKLGSNSRVGIVLAKHRSLPELYHRAEHASAPPNDGPYLESTKDCTYPVVATATPPALQLGPSLAQSLPQLRRHQKQPLALLISDCRDPLFDSTALCSSSPPSSVDRCVSWSKPMASRSLKATRRNLVVGLDTKKSSLTIDNDDHDIFTEIITDDHLRDTSSKRFSPLPPKLRTIRRRKRPGIGRTSSDPEGGSVKPIAISLTFSSSATPQTLPTKVSMSALCDRVSYSAETDSESRATFDAPSSPIPVDIPSQAPGSPERRASTTLSRPSTPLSVSTSHNPATVRLGHPSRPYYSAIRKQGISPPSSRRSSIKDPGHGVAPIRPVSYSPSFPLPASNSAPGLSPQRHLSLSAVPNTSSLVSAFSLDESDDNEDEELPVVPLTPLPASGRRSFGNSLASVAKSLTRKRSSSGPSAVSTSTASKFKHSHSSSSPQAVFPLSTAHLSLPPHHHGNMKGVFRMSSTTTAGNGAPGIGFSVSGEAELKMALAFSDAQTTKNNTGTLSFVSASTPAIQEEEDVTTGLSQPSLSPSPISPSSSLQLPTVSHSRNNSIAGRVKKLTRGLKGMLLMTTHGGAGNNNNKTNPIPTTATTPPTTP